MYSIHKTMNSTQQRGFLRWVIMLIIAIILVSYFFDFNLEEAVEDEQTQSNFQYILEQLRVFYETILLPAFHQLIEWIGRMLEALNLPHAPFSL